MGPASSPTPADNHGKCGKMHSSLQCRTPGLTPRRSAYPPRRPHSETEQGDTRRYKEVQNYGMVAVLLSRLRVRSELLQEQRCLIKAVPQHSVLSQTTLTKVQGESIVVRQKCCCQDAQQDAETSMPWHPCTYQSHINQQPMPAMLQLRGSPHTWAQVCVPCARRHVEPRFGRVYQHLSRAFSTLGRRTLVQLVLQPAKRRPGEELHKTEPWSSLSSCLPLFTSFTLWAPPSGRSGPSSATPRRCICRSC